MTAELIKNFASMTLANETGQLTDARIAAVVDQFLGMNPSLSDQRESILNQLRTNFSVSQDVYQALDTDDEDRRIAPWVKESRATSELMWRFWDRYYLYMQPKLATRTLNQLDDLTTAILDRLNNPRTPGAWERRGMVVGQVQSGKTGNYVGLMNKAADAGYKLIIVLAGLHDSLRNQTQVRIDEGFLGFNPTVNAMSLTKANNRIGVGKFKNNVAAHALTTRMGDFSKTVAQSTGTPLSSSDPIVLVIKKNPSILKNLIQWLAVQGETQNGKKLIENVPMLLIDDEADNASINTSKESISTINGLIRALLSLFSQNAYVGYTATPFANIFIPILGDDKAESLNTLIKGFNFKVGQDLFPRDFIINIPAPSNYIGPAKVFGLPAAAASERSEEALPVVINLDHADGSLGDYEAVVPNKHKKGDPLPSHLPASLAHAVKHFVLVCAARQVRGQVNQHNSMLVHISRFVPWIDRIASLVDKELKACQRQIEFNTGSLWDDLETIWTNEFIPVTETIRANMQEDINGYQDPNLQPLAWSDVREHLFSAVMKIEVRAIHGQIKTTGLEYHNIAPLDYVQAEEENPPRYLSIIAVGGDKLSRGLTLEGLSISYYLRASKMYDTLMQMGRWFGYRPGYVDLCRLFTSAELIKNYRFITLASEEVREDFDRMFVLNKTPREFGLKVRSHSGALIISALNKIREGVLMELSYSAELRQTHQMKIDKGIFRRNWDAFNRLLPRLGQTVAASNQKSAKRINHVWRTDNETVCQFLREYRIDSLVMNIPRIIEYIEQQTEATNLADWTVVLINNSEADDADKYTFSINSQLARVGLTSRSNAAKTGNQTDYTISKAQLISPPDEYSDLNDSQLAKALNETIADWIKNENKGEPKNPSTFRIKYNRPASQGLLLVYPLNPTVKESPNGPVRTISDVPIIGLAISFPNIEGDIKVTYLANKQFDKAYDYDDTDPDMSDE